MISRWVSRYRSGKMRSIARGAFGEGAERNSAFRFLFLAVSGEVSPVVRGCSALLPTCSGLRGVMKFFP